MRNCGLILFACSGLLLSGGTILGGSTIWGLIRISYYFWTSDLGVELGSGVLVAAGALLCLPACWLATVVPYHPRSLSLHGTLMCVVMSAMVLMSTGLLSTAGVARAVRDPALVNASMLRALRREPHEATTRHAFSAMQLELQCCGVHSYRDWYPLRSALPAACCGRVPKSFSDSCDVPSYTIGCLRPALVELRNYCASITVLGYCLVIVLSITLFATAYLLASNVIDRSEVRILKPSAAAMRFASLASQLQQPPPMPFTPLLPTPLSPATLTQPPPPKPASAAAM